MARLTFAELVEQGQLIGQNDATPSWVAAKLRAWLRKQYAGWAWPFLITQATGITMAAGTTNKVVGGGDGGLTRQVVRIFSPIYFRANGYSTRGKAPIRTLVGDPSEMAIGMVDADNQTGTPQSFIAMPFAEAGEEKISLVPYPVPEKDYTLAFTYQYLPDDPEDADIPVYPNEMTLLQAAKVAAIEYDQSADPLFRQELQILAEMVAADRSAYGGTPSFGDTMQLDSSVFLP